MIPVIVGAVIGYITNYLAIRMLFRPLHSVYFLGKRLPFTPGLIPKERDRLAHRTGIAVKEYLVTEEALLSHMESAALLTKLEEKLEGVLKRAQSNDTPIGTILEKYMQLQRETISRFLQDQIIKSGFFGWAQKEKTNRRLRKIVEKWIMPEQNRMIDTAFESICREWTNFVAKAETEEKLRKIFLDWIGEHSECPLEEIIPEPLLLSFLSQYNDQEDRIITLIKKALGTAQMQASIRVAIIDTLDTQLNWSLRTFLRTDAIANRVSTAIEKYLESEESTELIRVNIRLAIQNLLNMRLSDVTVHITEEKTSVWIKELLQGSVVLLGKEDQSAAVRSSLYQKDNIVSEPLLRVLTEIVTKSISEIPPEKIRLWTDSLTEQMLAVPVSRLIGMLGDDAPQKISRIVENSMKTYVPHLVRSVVERFGIDALVEDQIKKFDVKKLEEIIIEVADRELKAITNLGALLGALIGLIQPLLQSLY